jgi:hypothetical protein
MQANPPTVPMTAHCVKSSKWRPPTLDVNPRNAYSEIPAMNAAIA